MRHTDATTDCVLYMSEQKIILTRNFLLKLLGVLGVWGKGAWDAVFLPGVWHWMDFVVSCFLIFISFWQGKGEMTTYWLVASTASHRKTVTYNVGFVNTPESLMNILDVWREKMKFSHKVYTAVFPGETASQETSFRTNLRVVSWLWWAPW